MVPPRETAVLFTASSGMVSSWTETGRTLPVVVASRNTGCWLTVLACVAPTATTVPPGATVTLGIDSLAASPSDPVGCQAAPVPVLV